MMANTFYNPGSERAARVNDLFAGIALRYDLINDLQSFGLHRLWKRRLVRLANPKVGERALDLCCGTGDIALALARHGAEVAGLDFSEPMLEIARRKTSHSALRTPHFIQGDAQQIPFPDNSFEIVTVGYGLRNLASFETGLREMQRVARPGGRLLVLDFGKPDNTLWRSMYFGYLKFFVPVLGRIFCGSFAAYAYILESLQHYPAQRGVAEKMRALGLKNVRIVNFLGGVMSINCAEKA
jgi:demethylmenaquinone methyltransferase/2-methoxy-6-polyprenyl-1,4-benzoquinol methylase